MQEKLEEMKLYKLSSQDNKVELICSSLSRSADGSDAIDLAQNVINAFYK
jgi:hypothetical protein